MDGVKGIVLGELDIRPQIAVLALKDVPEDSREPVPLSPEFVLKTVTKSQCRQGDGTYQFFCVVCGKCHRIHRVYDLDNASLCSGELGNQGGGVDGGGHGCLS
jgi:hypothetical protein